MKNKKITYILYRSLSAMPRSQLLFSCFLPLASCFLLLASCLLPLSTTYSQDLPTISITSFLRSNDNVKYDPTEVRDTIYDYSIGVLYPYKFDNVTLGQLLYLYKDNIYDENKELEYTMQQFTARVFKMVKKDLVRVDIGYKDFGKKYYNAPYLSVTVNKSLTKEMIGIITATLEAREYPDNDLLNGSNTKVEVLLKRKNILVNYTTEGNRTRSGRYQYHSHTIGIKYNLPLLKKLKSEISYNFRYRDFTPGGRIDTRHAGGVNLSYPLANLIEMNAEYLYLNNDSNDNDKDYKSNIFAIGLNLRRLKF